MFEEGKKLVQYGANISRNIHYLHSLKLNTLYSVKLRAYSTGGKGPWSTEFTGRTLDKSKCTKKTYKLIFKFIRCSSLFEIRSSTLSLHL